MKFRIKLMVPKEVLIEADNWAEADKEARRLRDANKDPDGNETVKLLSVFEVTGEPK